MKIQSTRCPYCGYKLGLFETLQIKDNQTYTCKQCRNVSVVALSEKIKILITLFVAVSMAIIAIFSLIIERFFWGAMLLILVSILFYALVPIFIDLESDQIGRKN